MRGKLLLISLFISFANTLQFTSENRLFNATENQESKQTISTADKINHIQNLLENKRIDSAFTSIQVYKNSVQDKEQHYQLDLLLAQTFEAARLYNNAAKTYHSIYLSQQNKTDSLAWHSLQNCILNYNKAKQKTAYEDLLVEARRLLQIRYLPQRDAELLNTEAILYRKAGLFKEAHEAIDSAIQINKRLKDEVELSRNYTAKANAFYHQGEYESAELFFKHALQTGLKNKSAERRIKHKMNYASALHMTGKVLETQKNYEEILSDSMLYSVPKNTKASIFLNLAIMKIRTMKSGNIATELDSALHIAQEIRDFKLLKIAYKEKARFYSFHNQHKKAYKYSLITQMYMDSLKQDHLAEIMASVELNKAFLENERKQSELQLQRDIARDKNRKFILVLSILFAAFLVVIFRSQKQTQRFRKFFERSVKSLKHKHSDYMEILSEVEHIKNINISLKKDISRAKFILQENIDFYTRLSKIFNKQKDLPENIKELSSDLSNMFTLVKDSDVMSEHPDNNEVDLRNRIKQSFPDLTRNEIKLCILMRMDMSTKEISAYTNTAVGSVEVAKYRMRKKLGYESMSELMKRLNEI